MAAPQYRRKKIGRKLIECIDRDNPNTIVYVMSDADGYYEKQGYQKAGSVFEVPNHVPNE